MLAYGIISDVQNSTPRVAARVGLQVVDLPLLLQLGGMNVSNPAAANSLMAATLNEFIAQGLDFRTEVKAAVVAAIAAVAADPAAVVAAAIRDLARVTLHHPLKVGGFTDFYASKQHATNIGKIFLPQNPLLPNWEHLPIAYNGRASSVVISGHPVRRPQGQILHGDKPQLAPTTKLDLETELGIVIAKSNKLGAAIPIAAASEYIFGICLVNDWSARDIQAWEYQPLGPFTSKSFLTSISAFIIPLEELSAFKVAAPLQDPQPLAYLQETNPVSYDIRLEVSLKTATDSREMVISRCNFKDIYWTMQQWIAHHTVSGCNLQVGDILASGTISGNAPDSLGSLMELTVNGSLPLNLPNGEQRTFLADGDEIIIRGYCGTEAAAFAEVAGKILPQTSLLVDSVTENICPLGSN